MKPRPKLDLAVTIKEPAWRKAWPSARRDIALLLEKGLSAGSTGVPPALKKKGPAERQRSQESATVTIVLADDKTLRRLNRQFRGKDKATNVLSFEDPVEPLGGITISYQTVEREAKAQKKLFLNHSKHMILHGFLHLLGHDHQTKKDARLMEGIETAILTDLGIPNPY